MNNIIKGAFLFIFGAALGSGITYVVTKNKYEDILVESQKSLRDYYERKQEKSPKKEELKEDVSINVDINEHLEHDPIIIDNSIPENHEEIVNNLLNSYHTLSGEEKESFLNKPYIIEEDEYGQFEDYTYETYVLYEDGILADSDDKVFDDYEEVLGLEFIDHLKKYDIDAVYVRNDVLKKDFEIIPDSYRFEDIVDVNE